MAITVSVVAVACRTLEVLLRALKPLLPVPSSSRCQHWVVVCLFSDSVKGQLAGEALVPLPPLYRCGVLTVHCTAP
jgi:hypothetical protein